MSSFPARYRTVCAECDEWIAVGDMIVMTGVAAVHLNCTGEPGPPSTACTTCWLVHPEGECDR